MCIEKHVLYMKHICIQLYERRCMQAKGKEVEIMQQLSEKVMTDEETDCELNVLVRRTPPWRSKKLTKLMRTLDSRKSKKSEALPKKERRTGCFSERSPPKDLPKWALQDPPVSTSHQYSSSMSDASSPNPLPSSPVASPVSPQCEVTLPSQSSPPMQASTSTPMQSSTPRLSIRPSRSTSISPISTPLSHHVSILQGSTSSSANDSSSLESNLEDCLSDMDSDDEMSTWIRAVTRVK